MSQRYNKGDEVQCISDPSRIGIVVEICESHAGLQYYRVNFGGGFRPKKSEADLRPFIPNPSPADNLIRGNIDSYQEFQRLITYQRIIRDHPLRNNIYAFNASRTRFFPYQFKPLIKFLDSPRHRLLIADEVGLGKTIEAGLILTELRARQTVQRVLVVCPSSLTGKWRMELKQRFGEDFRILDAKKFMELLDEYEDAPEDVEINGIVSLESSRRQAVLERLEALAPNFDLVIVDEAHHMRNFGRKQREVGVLLGRSADAMLLLTATPVHLGNENLFSLLNILDEEEFPDFSTVDQRFRENEPLIRTQVCMGQLPANVGEAIDLMKGIENVPLLWGNPLYQEIMDGLLALKGLDYKTPEARSVQLKLQRDLAELNLIGHVFSRTRKREVQSHMPIRKAFPLRLRLTELERLFYDAVTVYVRTQAEQNASNSSIVGWLLIMPQRRMASSIPAMVEFYRTHFNLTADALPEDFQMDDDIEEEIKTSDGILQRAEQLLKAVIQRWPQNGPDSKYDKFIEILHQLKKQEDPIKVMVFAFFKDTLRYLQRRLTEDGFQNVLLSGDIAPDDRINYIEQFRSDEQCEIMLSSRVGSEGLDFQFCSILFNYDLPWNPMEVEQRIGRLDRIGQEASVIRIYNFWIEDTIEQRILERLYSRIEIFERSVGELEMILGDELSTLERDILSRQLTPQDEEQLIETKAMVIENRMVALQKLEREAAQFIGTDQYFDEEVKSIRTHRRYITGEQMRRFITDFIRSYCPGTRLEYNQETALGRIFPDEKLRQLLLSSTGSSEAIRYSASSRHGISITFESHTAFENPKVDFVNVLHLLTQSIVQYYKETKGVHSNAHHIVLRTNRIPQGLFLYFIYKLRVNAARSVNSLEMVILNQNLEIACSDEDAEILLGEMVEMGTDSRGVPYQVNHQRIEEACQKAEAIFHRRIEQIRENVSRNNDAFVGRRLESLKTSYGKMIRTKRILLEQAITRKRQDRYVRMVEGTIRRLEAELSDKSVRLELQKNVEVSYDDIATGILEVTDKTL